MSETTATTGNGVSISAEEMIKQINDVMEKLGPPLPEIRQSPLVKPGQIIKIPAEHSLSPYGKREMWFVSPEDYKKYVEEIE